MRGKASARALQACRYTVLANSPRSCEIKDRHFRLGSHSSVESELRPRIR